ncbi:hypothetical protein EZV73_08440 [Acidaminobacter sp. JC074]|uniref:hypothetical protein n=1 Tax=Acidaminobacter sp. JC074 TaxID=2530199 RepID=UPI001F10F044|nr:hypothetical protein [Acidaminobacter sp. JC074]MCH4887598.1 hypothetical protein [Acidaminobacter sp. JC074]
MITGHFTTALVPYGNNKKYPLVVLLILTQIQDFLIPVDMMLQNLGLGDFRILEMTYSHDIVPALILSFLSMLIIHLIYKNRSFTLWAGFLVIFHEVCDLLAGFSHHIMGPHTQALGFDFYRQNQVMAAIIEGMLAIICIGYYVKKRKDQNDPISRGSLIGLLTVVFAPIIGFGILGATVGVF